MEYLRQSDFIMKVQFFILALFLFPGYIYSIEQIGQLSWGVRIRETYQMHSEMSLIDCASLCLNNTGCCSINYSQMLHLCELNYQTKEHGTMYNNEDTDTFLQSNIKTWKKIQSDSCQSDRCGSNKQCTDVNRCVISDCGKLPAGPEHSYVVEHGNHVIGSGAVFACKDGYDLFKGKVASDEKYVVVTCSSNGIWDIDKFSCEGEDDFKPIDCTDVRRFISTESGVYLIKPQGSNTTFKVFCEMEANGTAWAVFQRRKGGTVEFDRGWTQYTTGFGSLRNGYWLGNDKLHILSTQTRSKLRIDLEDFDNNTAYALYGTFAIGPESQGYDLTATEYTGTAGNALAFHNGNSFAAKDTHNDNSSSNVCAYSGGWWFNQNWSYGNCVGSNLNGQYLTGSPFSLTGIRWTTWYTNKNLKSTSMKVTRDIKECATAKSCDDIKQCGNEKSGVYRISMDDSLGHDVYCDFDDQNNVWTVFQRRQDGSENFYRGWVDYKEGFGNLHGEFWLGNELMHSLSSQGQYMMRVELTDFCGESRFAEYSTFKLGNEESNYKLTVNGYSGTAGLYVRSTAKFIYGREKLRKKEKPGDSLHYHNGRPFSTKDRDNDKHDGNCAVYLQGAWWYGKCASSNLNGRYFGQRKDRGGNMWHSWQGFHNSFKITKMKIRQKSHIIR